MRIVSTLIACLALTLAGSTAEAYCLYKVTGAKQYVAWKAQPVVYQLSTNLKDAKIKAAIAKAFATWGAVKCSKLKFSAGKGFTICADTACKAFTNPTKYIYLYWFTAKSDLFKNTSNPKLPYMSYTYVTHDNAGGLAGASIGVNGKDYAFGTTGAAGLLDVQNEVTRLIGSVIGLTDSKVKDASMYSSIAYGETSKRTLHQDDINGLIYLYKDKGCPSPPAPGAGGCSSGTTSPDSGPPKLDTGVPPKTDSSPPATDMIGSIEKGTPPKQDGQPVYPDQGTTYQDTGGSGGCTKQADCASDEVCTIEGSCVKKGSGGCTKRTDCAANQECTIDGRCVDTDDGGCSCRVGSSGLGAGSAIFALLGVLLLAGRRRRWRR